MARPPRAAAGTHGERAAVSVSSNTRDVGAPSIRSVALQPVQWQPGGETCRLETDRAQHHSAHDQSYQVTLIHHKTPHTLTG
jgi:hypothetical protein